MSIQTSTPNTLDLTQVKKKNKSKGRKSIYVSDDTSEFKFIEQFEKFCYERKLSQKSVVEQLIIKLLADHKVL